MFPPREIRYMVGRGEPIPWIWVGRFGWRPMAWEESLHMPVGLVRTLVFALLGGLAGAGCRWSPARVKQPKIDPAAAGKRALEAYDTDRDGRIAGPELDASPALKSALARFDMNHDGGISAAEIAGRVQVWKAMKTGLASVRCQVTLDGKPLSGAKVDFVPEPFLGGEVKPASGTVNQFGDVAPSVSDADKPDPKLPGGVHFGLYTVTITGGRDSIPARYNASSTLGLEVSYDEPGIRDNNLAFRLKAAD